MAKLTRLVTKIGDGGTTRLGDGSTVPKTDPRIEAIGALQEVNAAIGVSLADWQFQISFKDFGDSRQSSSWKLVPRKSMDDDDPDDAQQIGAALHFIQNELFDVGSDLSVPLSDPEMPGVLRIDSRWTDFIEAVTGMVVDRLTPLSSFVIPGGGQASAHLHIACATARRAERAAWAAVEAHGLTAPGGVNPEIPRYLNRLSDLLFAVARQATPAGREVLWERIVPPTA